MVDLSDFTPEQLQKYLDWAKGDQSTMTPDDLADAARDQQYLSHQASSMDKPIGSLGDVLDKDKLQSAVKQDPSKFDLAQQKAQQAAQGTSGDGVISDLPPTRRFEALDKLNQAAKGTSDSTPINPEMEFPTSSGLERMATPEELAKLPSKGASVAENALKSSIPGATADQAMTAAVEGGAGAAGTMGILDYLKSKLPMDTINKYLGKTVYESPGAERATYDLMKAGQASSIKGGAKALGGLAGSGVDAAISGAGSVGSKVLKNVTSGPVAGALLASDALQNGDTSPEQRELMKQQGAQEAAENPDLVAAGKGSTSISYNAPDLTNLVSPSDTKLSPEEQAANDKFAQLLAAKKAAGMLPYQQAQSDADNLAKAGINPDKNASLFDMVSDKYKAEQQPGQPLAPQAPVSTAGKGLAKSSTPPTDRAPAVQSQQLSPEQSLMTRYSNAMDAANMGTLTAQLGKAGALVGSGIVGTAGITKPTEVHDKIFDTNLAVAQQIPEQFMKKLELERQDPGSDSSQAARNFIKQTLNINVPDNMSASQLKEQFPVIEKLLAARESAKMRAFLAQQNLELRKEAMAATQSRHEDNLNMRGEALRTRIQNNIERDPLVTTTAKRRQSIQRARELLASNLPISPQLLHDISREMASGMTGTTSVAQSFVKDVDFSTAASMLANNAQKLTGNVQDLRKSSPQILTYLDNVLGKMDQGFEADYYQRQAEVAARQDAATNNANVHRGMQVYTDNWDKYGKKHPDALQRTTTVQHALGQGAPVADSGSSASSDTPASPSSVPPVTHFNTPNGSPMDMGSFASGIVKIRRKSDGMTKTLPIESAQKYLKSKDFEEVK